MFERIKDPMRFQGGTHYKKYFEGWYFKQVSQDEKTVISFIPGISLFEHDAHCFVQYIHVKEDLSLNKTTTTGYIRYPLTAFSVNKAPFSLQIGGNYFSETEIKVHLTDERGRIEGSIKLGPLTPVQTSILAPNIMGYFAYIPKMECYHGVISMNHRLSGSLDIHSETVNFEQGKGYIEKDWGTSFPKAYVWIQCNHFSNSTLGIFVSVAEIPFMTRSFKGYLCNLTLDGHEYRFATYNKSTLIIENIKNEFVKLAVENAELHVTIEADFKHSGDLIAPTMGRMDKVIKEGLSGNVRLRIYNKSTQTVYEDNGIMAGIEVVGY